MQYPTEESPKVDKNILDEPHGGPSTAVGGAFSLTEQMINKKHMVKARNDIQRMKGLISEM